MICIILSYNHCTVEAIALKDTESSVEDKTTNNVNWNRFRRQSFEDIETVKAILSIIPLDQIGAIIGQVLAIGVQNMFDSNAGDRILNMLQEQAPTILTGLFSNLYGLAKPPAKKVDNQNVISISQSSSLTTAASSKLRNGSSVANVGYKTQMDSILLSSLFKK
ncbi:unnamed protein product [Didymodactylos carnosus]|uniref:Uncharacterized protein n=1 Tax=Didymodactylos carnosus TaxID=1234261 RepID=A0A814C450_9BILA|nr:unnamed protein product [Didymodactylos carnosus]CAF1069827.1 unnamed protein product [Didymodactylos carnosus]CAF3713658.1 unnamed protein product [Didymodactylos carnosus]CAF3834337.1 unnamed protein product [Didymodactylos carnosus]